MSSSWTRTTILRFDVFSTIVCQTTYCVISKERLPVMASLADVEKYYGSGNRLYFNFILFSIFVNAVLLALAIIEWSFYMSDPSRVLIRGPFEWKDFFVSEYLRPNQDKVWFWCSIVAAMLYPAFPIIYYVWERVFFRQRKLFEVVWAQVIVPPLLIFAFR